MGNVPKERPYLVAGDVSWDSGTKEKQRIPGVEVRCLLDYYYIIA